MYSLYRAWFGGGENYPRTQDALSPPDTVVRVGNEGEHQFVAHKGVLAAHSGYLKALLASAAPVVSASDPTSSTAASRLPSVTSVSVSSIGGEAFAPLLNYMYTGRLEVTLDNVYSVLLATHLLHMPGALEQCRAALLRLREPPAPPPPLPNPLPPPLQLGVSAASSSAPVSTAASTSGSVSILRPIPNRLMVGPPLCWHQPPLYSADGMSHLAQLQPMMIQPPVISVLQSHVEQDMAETGYSSEIPSPNAYQQQQQQQQRGGGRKPRSRSPEAAVSVPMPFAAAFNAFARSSAALAEASSSPAPSSEPSSPTVSPSRRKILEEKDRKSEESAREVLCHPEAQFPGREKREEGGTSCKEPNPQVDPPRNHTDNSGESFGACESERSRGSRRKVRSSSSCQEPSSSGNDGVVYDVACCDGPVRFQRVLNENYSSSGQVRLTRTCPTSTDAESGENDENGGPGPDLGAPDPVPDGSGSGSSAGLPGVPDATTGLYTCGYCRHTFKSQYCYRKHAKRHLLPSQLNADAERNRQRQESTRGARREVRLLDLNVQYYPCKICGCKFPSYYFVHKHRKLCHSNLEEQPRPRLLEGPGENSQEQIAPDRETS